MARRRTWLVGTALAALVLAAPARADTATLTVTPSSPEIVFGEEVAFDAVVAGAAGTPTGTVTFVAGGEEPVEVPLADGAAAFVPELLLGVDEPVTAAYSGDAVYDPVAASDVAPVVRLAPTSTALTVAPSTVAAGGQVQVTVLVSNTATLVTPVGDVGFLIDGVAFAPVVRLDDDGRAAFPFTVPAAPGDHRVTARYADTLPPWPYYEPSEATLTVRVTAPPATPAGGTPPPIGPATPQRVLRRSALTTFGLAVAKRLQRRGLAGLAGTLAFDAPVAGVLTQRILRRGTLLAAGRRVFARAGLRTLRTRPTRAGRRALRRGGRVALRVVTRFAPAEGTPVSVTRRVTVRGRG